MTAYLDSSVLLRTLLNQHNKLLNFNKIERPISSKLLKPECLRTLDRLRVRGYLSENDFVSASEELYEALDSVELVEIDNRVLERSGSSLPIPLGTLDAIHLSSAAIWRETFEIQLKFLTHDEALGKAARSIGFQVYGC